MVLLQNQLLRSCHEKWTHLKWRPNNTFGSTQKLCITTFGNLKHPEGIKKASGKRFYLSPLLSRPPFSNQSKNRWRNYTNSSTTTQKKIIAKSLIHIKLSGYAHRTPIREPFPWHPPVAGRGNAGMALLKRFRHRAALDSCKDDTRYDGKNGQRSCDLGDFQAMANTLLILKLNKPQRTKQFPMAQRNYETSDF
jgi:hypothetical protein